MNGRAAGPGGGLWPLAAAGALTVPALAVWAGALDGLGDAGRAALLGLGILGAAILITFAAEVAEMDVSRGLVLALVAFVAVLPEYAVDLALTWRAGQQDAAGGLPADLCGAEACRDLLLAK